MFANKVRVRYEDGTWLAVSNPPSFDVSRVPSLVSWGPGTRPSLLALPLDFPRMMASNQRQNRRPPTQRDVGTSTLFTLSSKPLAKRSGTPNFALFLVLAPPARFTGRSSDCRASMPSFRRYSRYSRTCTLFRPYVVLPYLPVRRMEERFFFFAWDSTSSSSQLLAFLFLSRLT